MYKIIEENAFNFTTPDTINYVSYEEIYSEGYNPDRLRRIYKTNIAGIYKIEFLSQSLSDISFGEYLWHVGYSKKSKSGTINNEIKLFSKIEDAIRFYNKNQEKKYSIAEPIYQLHYVHSDCTTYEKRVKELLNHAETKGLIKQKSGYDVKIIDFA